MSGELTIRTQIGKRVVSLRWSNRVLCRHGSLDRPLGLADITKPKRGVTALCQWVWACLDKSDAAAFESPDDVADELRDDQFAVVAQSLQEAITAANPTKEKNEESSTPSPSPASS